MWSPRGCLRLWRRSSAATPPRPAAPASRGPASPLAVEWCEGESALVRTWERSAGRSAPGCSWQETSCSAWVRIRGARASCSGSRCGSARERWSASRRSRSSPRSRASNRRSGRPGSPPLPLCGDLSARADGSDGEPTADRGPRGRGSGATAPGAAQATGHDTREAGPTWYADARAVVGSRRHRATLVALAGASGSPMPHPRARAEGGRSERGSRRAAALLSAACSSRRCPSCPAASVRWRQPFPRCCTISERRSTLRSPEHSCIEASPHCSLPAAAGSLVATQSAVRRRAPLAE